MIHDSLILRWLLFPVSLLFGLAVSFKNLLYRTGLLNSVRFSVPVISIGNLNVGGAGKSPHTEYLLRLLRQHVKVAVMSRGFGRRTAGYQLVRPEQGSDTVGDEALVFARKYPDIAVAVSESRSIGIPLLLQQYPDLQLILLDDAYQHRSVTPYLNILLTEYSNPFYCDWLMPSGSLREWRNGYRRADIIIVTKCPSDLTVATQLEIIRKIDPTAQQTIYFTTYRHHDPYAMYVKGARMTLSDKHSVLLVSGIARTDYLFEYVASQAGHVDLMEYADHHRYTMEDINIIMSRFKHLEGLEKIILTTEKDAVRLEAAGFSNVAAQLPIYLLPVEVVFLNGDGTRFDDQIRNRLLEFKV